MKIENNTIIGLTLLTILLIQIFIYFGIKGILILTLLFFYGWLSVKIYETKTKSWASFLAIKVPLNIFFNPFLIVLLLKSWTISTYRKELEDLDRKLIASGKLKNT